MADEQPTTTEKPQRDMVIYGLVRTDLPSMNYGKAVAHGIHAGNQILKYANHPLVKAYIEDGKANGADFFNTAITLGATRGQIKSIVEMARKLGFIGEFVYDPSYPFFVDAEAAALIPAENAVNTGIPGENGTVLMTRGEDTIGWIMGDKMDPLFRAIVGALKLAK